AALAYARAIGAQDRLIGPSRAEFAFFDLANREKWTLRFNDGRVPWWIFDPRRRVPGTHALDYLSVGRLLWAPRSEEHTSELQSLPTRRSSDLRRSPMRARSARRIG